MFTNLRIGTRLAIGFGLVLGLLLMVSVFGSRKLRAAATVEATHRTVDALARLAVQLRQLALRFTITCNDRLRSGADRCSL